MKKKLLLWHGSFNYSRELTIKYSMAPTWGKAFNNMVDQLAKEHGVSRRIVKSIFDGSKPNFEIIIDPEWRLKHENKT